MNKILNIGLVGCGRITDLHAAGYQRDIGAKIYAVCDRDQEAVERRKREFGAEKAYTDFRELIADPKVDAVEILTPQTEHEWMVIAAAQAGKHVSVQKPMTDTLASADRTIEAVRKTGVVYKVYEHYVSYPAIVKAKQLIEAGVIGDLLSLRMKYLGGTTGGWAIPSAGMQWRIQEMAKGYGCVTFDHGHHMWAAAWYLMGDVERVITWVNSFDGVTDSPAVVTLKHKNAQRLSVCDMAQTEMHIPSKYYPNDEWFEITGTKGALFINRCTGNIHKGPVLTHFDGTDFYPYDLPSDWVEGFVEATRNFVRAIRGEERPNLTPEQGREVLRTTLAIRKSALVRREVYLDELDHWWPSFYAWREQRRHRHDGFGVALPANKKFSLFKDRTSQYAPQAVSLTRELMTRFNADAVKGWQAKIGLRLAADGTFKGEALTLVIENGRVTLEEGKILPGTVFTAEVKAGTWAAILLKKKRPETAVLQGRFKLEGKAEEALKLRGAFGI